MPPLDEIASRQEFQPRVISKEEFDQIWNEVVEARSWSSPTVSPDNSISTTEGVNPMIANRLEEEFVQTPDWAMDRARHGAAWLDSKFGPEWDEKIDLDRLDVGSPCACILGQLIGCGYWSLVFVSLGTAVQCGFSLGAWDVLAVLWPTERVKQAYFPLNDAWKLILRERCDRGAIGELGTRDRNPQPERPSARFDTNVQRRSRGHSLRC